MGLDMKSDKIRPFTIDVAPGGVERLAAAAQKNAVVLSDSGHKLGCRHRCEYLKELVAYWRDTYDWRKHETALNQFAHFKTEVDDIGIHFIHERGKGPNPFPLILTHGYPDSFYRFAKIIPMLTDPGVIRRAGRRRFRRGCARSAGLRLFRQTEQARDDLSRQRSVGALDDGQLGYERFGAHGGDWGSTVTEQLARSHADSVVAIHLTDVPFGHIFQKPDDPSPAERKFFRTQRKWLQKEGAYATDPVHQAAELAQG